MTESTRELFIADVLNVTWDSPSIAYWAKAGKRRDSIVETDVPNPRRFKLNAALVEAGLAKLHDRKFKVSDDLRGRILCAEVLCDGGMIDSDAADVIIQAGCFGEIIYG